MDVAKTGKIKMVKPAPSCYGFIDADDGSFKIPRVER